MRVETPRGAYEVFIGDGLLDDLGTTVKRLTDAATAAVVTDENVMRLYGSRVERSLAGAGFRVIIRAVPAGETSKDWATAGGVLEWLADEGVGRDDVVVALGGGVVGDLAGFCASAYMRGVDVVQVPTTLLGQVDSAIGGKTAVDLPGGKNLAGAFWQPRAVFADLGTLATLPEAEWRNGLAEVAKSAILDSEAALCRLEADAPALGDRDAGATERAVRMAAGLKVRTVSSDERDTGDRESLNYGHTLGHAIERVAGYGSIGHGVAVAEGMRFAATLAERMAGADAAWTARQEALLTDLGLPRSGCEWPAADLLRAIRADKKARRGRPRFVLTSGAGTWSVVPVTDQALSDALEVWCAGPGPAGEGRP